MLVSQDDLVKVHRDSYFVVGEVPQPGSLGLDRVGQQWHNLQKRYGYRFPLVFDEADGFVLRTVVNSQMTGLHGGFPSLMCPPRPSCFLLYRLWVGCGFDVFQGKCALFG